MRKIHRAITAASTDTENKMKPNAPWSLATEILTHQNFVKLQFGIWAKWWCQGWSRTMNVVQMTTSWMSIKTAWRLINFNLVLFNWLVALGEKQHRLDPRGNNHYAMIWVREQIYSCHRGNRLETKELRECTDPVQVCKIGWTTYNSWLAF